MEIETLEEALLEKIEKRFDMNCFMWSQDKHSLINFIIKETYKDISIINDEMKKITFKKIFQCGHCGSIDEDKIIIEECCGGFAEECFQCIKCKCLHYIKPKVDCLGCKHDASVVSDEEVKNGK